MTGRYKKYFIKPVPATAHRLVSSLELFLDLVLVAAIYHIGNLQAKDFISNSKTQQSSHAVASFFYFFGMWLSWYQFSHFMSRYYAKDTLTKVHFCLMGLSLMGMAAFTLDDFDAVTRDIFGFAFVSCRLYLTLMNVIVAVANAEVRRSALGFCLVYLLTSLFIVVGGYTPTPVSAILWSVAYLFEAVGTFFAERRAPPVPLELMAERHGELFMIAIGENIIQLVISTAKGVTEVDAGHVVMMFFSYLIAFMMQLLYFECQPHDETQHAYHRGGLASFLFVYGHGLLIFFTMGIGVSVKLFLKISNYYYTRPSYAWFFAVCLVSAIVLNNIIRLSHSAFRGKAHVTVAVRPHQTFIKRLFIFLRIVLIIPICIAPIFAKKMVPLQTMIIFFVAVSLMVWVDVMQRALFPQHHEVSHHHGHGEDHGGGGGEETHADAHVEEHKLA